MADNAKEKNYYIQPEEVGSIKISEEVVASIAGLAASETDGVSTVSAGIAGDIATLLGKKSASRGVKILFEADRVTIDIFILVRYGYVVPDVAKKVQDKVQNSVESMTGLTVSAVNVNVAGISFETKNKKPSEQEE